MDALPDPMRPDYREVLFVMAVVTILFWVLKLTFFKPVVAMIDAREGRIKEGSAKRTEALALVEQRQADYQARMTELRAKAFEHKRALAEAASAERARLMESTRSEIGLERTAAMELLATQSEAAKVELVHQVDRLSESMVSAILKA